MSGSRRRMPIRALIALALVAASVGIAVLWARSYNPAAPTTMQTGDAAPALPAGTAEPARAPTAPTPRGADDRSAGVPPSADSDAAPDVVDDSEQQLNE